MMESSQTFDTQSYGKRRRCRCASETSAVASHIPNQDTVAFELIVEGTEQTIEAWHAIRDCQVCEGSYVQIYTDYAEKLITLFESAIHAYPDETGGGSHCTFLHSCSSFYYFI
jgi:hypothetical protein